MNWSQLINMQPVTRITILKKELQVSMSCAYVCLLTAAQELTETSCLSFFQSCIEYTFLLIMRQSLDMLFFSGQCV